MKKNNLDIAKNNVSSKGQIKEYDLVRTINNNGKLSVLFVGNSITRHAPAKDIDWLGDWGMAASSEETDYVHLVVKGLEKKYGKVNFCTACCADWEREYYNDEKIETYNKARDFNADVIVIRLGENVYKPIADDKDEKPLYPKLNNFIKYFNKSGKAKIIITGLFWQFEIIENILEKIALDNGYIFVRLNDISLKNENKAIGQFKHEGVCLHPNDSGMSFIANRILEKI